MLPLVHPLLPLIIMSPLAVMHRAPAVGRELLEWDDSEGGCVPSTSW